MPGAAIVLAVMHLASPPISWWATSLTLGKIARKGTALAEHTMTTLARRQPPAEHVLVLNAPDAAVGRKAVL